MTYYDMKGPVRKILPAIVAGVALLLGGAFSIGGLHAFGHYFSLGLIPLLAITVWPRHANTIISLIIVFTVGLFIDWASGGVTGQWALILTIAWGLFRPELRDVPFSPMSVILAWIATCTLAAILIFVIGLFVYGIYPDVWSLSRQVIAATIFLPLVLFLRRSIAPRLGDSDSWGR